MHSDFRFVPIIRHMPASCTKTCPLRHFVDAATLASATKIRGYLTKALHTTSLVWRTAYLGDV